ncbi:MAG: S41 family peptidase [Miltoncostaeaceae bacterium]
MPLRLLKAVLTTALVFAIFLAGVIVGGHPQSTGLTQLSQPLRGVLLGDSGQDLPSQVLDVLRREYYRDLDEEELEQRSVEAIIEALDDPYTAYLDEEALAALDFHQDGAYVGVGIQVAARADALVITRVYPDSPAARAGIAAGDRIVSVEGFRAGGGSLDAVVGLIRGPEGSDVEMVVRTGTEEPRDLTLTRSRVRIPPVRSRVIERRQERVGYLKLDRFTRGAAEALRERADDLLAEDVDGLVLDLRQDPGGLVNEAVGVAAVFLPEGSAVVTTEGRAQPRRTLRTSADPVGDGEVPLVVLVDRNSASSAEIVAGALRDGDRARLVGEPTFGKALVQSTWLLRDGGALRLTTARYLTPDGFDLAERGLPPDVRSVDDPDTPADEALDAAVRDLLADPSDPSAPAPSATAPVPAPASP